MKRCGGDQGAFEAVKDQTWPEQSMQPAPENAAEKEPAKVSGTVNVPEKL